MEILQIALLLLVLVVPILADPETNLLQTRCSTVKSTNVTVFQQNLNATLASVLQAVASSRFATEEQVTGSDPVYVLAQCRQDKNSSDCVKCITAAEKQIQNCSNVSGGRTTYDGCFLRYDSYNFSAQDTATGNIQLCGQDHIRTGADSFSLTSENLLSHLCTATPKTADFFAAHSAKDASNRSIYAVAWCLKSLTSGGCTNCLSTARENIGSCLSQSEGRTVDDGCFLRYATYPFYSQNATTDIAQLYSTGESEKILTWEERFNIILGTARGLAYLHEDTPVSIIHRDIKSSNILLNDNLQPKIADFGLARLIPDDRSHLTTRIAGTLGYTAPEYAIHGQLTEKADTYSYGVVVLELISGRKSIDIKQPSDMEYLLEWAWKLYEGGNIIDIVDKRMEKDEVYNEDEVLKVFNVALLCVQASVADRPSMSQVVEMLVSRADNDYRKPFQPVFVDVGYRIRGEHSSFGSGSSQWKANITESFNAS